MTGPRDEGTGQRPLVLRVLGIRQIELGGALSFLLFEGSGVLGILLALAELVSWWAVVVLPVTVAVMVKINDLVVDGLLRSARQVAHAAAGSGFPRAIGRARVTLLVPDPGRAPSPVPVLVPAVPPPGWHVTGRAAVRSTNLGPSAVPGADRPDDPSATPPAAPRPGRETGAVPGWRPLRPEWRLAVPCPIELGRPDDLRPGAQPHQPGEQAWEAFRPAYGDRARLTYPPGEDPGAEPGGHGVARQRGRYDLPDEPPQRRAARHSATQRYE